MCLRPQPAFMNEPMHEAVTTIFARVDGPRQWLAYALRADITEEISVAIPLPVAEGTTSSDIVLDSLEAVPEFFTLIQRPFRRHRVAAPPTRGAGDSFPDALEVTYLGDYAASVAANAEALARVHPELALRPSALAQVPSYATHAFVILRLKPPRRVMIEVGKPRRAVEHHAIVISFPTNAPDVLFFPTLVAHNGMLPESVRYDHLLFCQTRSDRQPEAGWERSARPLGRYVAEEIVPAVDASRHVYRRSIRVVHRNEDLRLPEPPSH